MPYGLPGSLVGPGGWAVRRRWKWGQKIWAIMPGSPDLIQHAVHCTRPVPAHVHDLSARHAVATGPPPTARRHAAPDMVVVTPFTLDRLWVWKDRAVDVDEHAPCTFR